MMKQINKNSEFINNPHLNQSILIVDNEVELSELLELYLKRSSHNFKNVKRASKVSEALKLLRTENFDAIIIDYQLDDDTTGLDIVKEIRKFNNFILILLLTGHGSRDLVIESMKHSVDDFILKPIDYSNFADTLCDSIERKKRLFHRIKSDKKLSLHNKRINNIKFDPFTHFIILYKNSPLYIKGNWIETNEDSANNLFSNDEGQKLVTGFIASLQSFSSSFFGSGSLVQEITFDENVILFSQINNYDNALISAIRLRKEDYIYLEHGNNNKLVLNALTKVLERVIEIFQLQEKKQQILNEDDIELLNYQLGITTSNLIYLSEEEENANLSMSSNKNNKSSFFQKITSKFR